MAARKNNPQVAEQKQQESQSFLSSLLAYVLPVRRSKTTAPQKEAVTTPVKQVQTPQVDVLSTEKTATPAVSSPKKKKSTAKKSSGKKTTKQRSAKKTVKKKSSRKTTKKSSSDMLPPAWQRSNVGSVAERHQQRTGVQRVSEEDKHGLLDLEFIDLPKQHALPAEEDQPQAAAEDAAQDEMHVTSTSALADIPVSQMSKKQVVEEMHVDFSENEEDDVDEEELRDEVEQEGFLESVTPEEKKSAALSAKKVQVVEEQEDPAQLKKKLKEKAKREKAEEERWKKEAEKLEKKQKQEEKKEKEEASKQESGPIKYKLPEVKKRSPLQAMATSLAYMGLDKERTAFIDNLATMMDAGLPLLDALRVLQKEARKGPMRKVLARIVVAVETGSPLWRAMDGQYFFKQQQVAMVRVGEESGSLSENLRYLAEQEEKDRTLKGKVKTAMIYPTIVLVMLTLIVFGLGLFVLPNLVQVIISLGVPLPFVTRVIIAFTDIFTTYTKEILLSFSVFMLTFVLLTKYTSFKVVVEWFLYKIPGVGVLIKEATLSRFGVVMGGLLRAGVPITEALESLANATGLTRYKRFYEELLERIQLGDAFSTSFEKIKSTNKCFPVSMQQLIITGEQSGSLTKIMLKVSEIHEKRASEVAEKLPVIIEPLLLLFIGGLVATIALGVLAPIYSVVGNIGG